MVGKSPRVGTMYGSVPPIRYPVVKQVSRGATFGGNATYEDDLACMVVHADSVSDSGTSSTKSRISTLPSSAKPVSVYVPFPYRGNLQHLNT